MTNKSYWVLVCLKLFISETTRDKQVKSGREKYH